MKLILAAIPFSFSIPAKIDQPASNPEDVCVSKLADTHADDNCKDERAFYHLRTLIGLINCPNGEASATENPSCAGGYSWWDTAQNHWKSYDQLVAQAIRDYGCNCFPENKWINNVFGKEWRHVMPGVNGEPIDALDEACTVFAKRAKCLNIDFNSLDRLEDWPGSNGGNPRHTCDYIQWYTTHDSGSGLTCGPASNPNYIDAESWWYNDQNIGYHNMNQCRNAICEMEMEFAYAVADMLKDPVAFKLENLSNYKAWDKGMCELKNHGMNFDSCCGEKNVRSPFDSSKRQCCDGEVVGYGSC